MGNIKRENEVFILLCSVVEEAVGCYPSLCICLGCAGKIKMNFCSEIWHETWGGQVVPIPENPCTHPTTPPIMQR